ncbi:MAG: chloride channel protein, partial [Acidimicrobiales bacterium]
MMVSGVVDRWGYLRKWLVLGAIIGISAGLGAIVFYSALRLGTYLFLGMIGGYHAPSPIGEGGVAGSAGFSHPWAIPLTAGLGGLLAGLIVFGLAPEAEGHGTDSAIDAFHHNPKGIRARVSAVKIVASALTIGSGGSGGREGPTGQISAGFASLLGRWTNLSVKTTRLAVAAGVGSGIGAIFIAPIGGAVLGPEILYTEDFEAEALIPSLVASVVAFAIFGAYVGYIPLFGSHESFGFQPTQIGYYLLIGVLGGLLGRAYATGFYGIARVFHRLTWPRPLKPAPAGLAVGALGLAVPQVLGTGYGWVQRSMGPSLLVIPLWIVLVAPLARIAATAFSIGSGGSGGIFGPEMVIGAFTGAGVWRVAHDLGLAVSHGAAPFVIVGMVACFGSVSHAPIAVLLMVTEMTGSLNLILASMLALVIAVVITGKENIYRAQLVDRAASPTHRQNDAGAMSANVSVGAFMVPPRLVVNLATEARTALAELRHADLPAAPVIDGSRRYRGVVTQQDLVDLPEDRANAPLNE